MIVDINESVRKNQAREIFLRNLWERDKDSWNIKDKPPSYKDIMNVNN